MTIKPTQAQIEAARRCIDELECAHIIGEGMIWDHSRPWREVAAERIAALTAAMTATEELIRLEEAIAIGLFTEDYYSKNWPVQPPLWPSELWLKTNDAMRYKYRKRAAKSIRKRPLEELTAAAVRALKPAEAGSDPFVASKKSADFDIGWNEAIKRCVQVVKGLADEEKP